jgi:hypothetical protein
MTRPSLSVTRGKATRRPASGTGASPAAEEPVLDLTPLVSDVIGTGPDAHRLVRVGLWAFRAGCDADASLEIPDTVLAERLGLPLRKLSELSGRHEAAGNIAPRIVEVSSANKSHGGTYSARGRGRPGMQRFYGEADALFLVTRSETKRAVALTKEMILVYMAARRGLLRPVAAAPAVDPNMARAFEALGTLIAQVQTVQTTQETIARQVETTTSALAGRIAALESELSSGVIGVEGGSLILRALREAGKLAGRGDKKAAARFRSQWDKIARNGAQWVGPRTSWYLLPRKKLAIVESYLDSARLEAQRLHDEAAAQAAKAAAAKQAELPFKPN